MSVAYETYTTFDSAYLDDVVRGMAALVEPRNTVTWDLIPEEATIDSREYVWYDAVTYELSGTIGANWDGSSTTPLNVGSDLGAVVQIGDVLKVGDEAVVVSGIVSRAGYTVTVHERGHGDTSAATHTSGDAIYIIGSAHVEGTSDQDGLLEDNIERKNYSQIVEEKVKLSRSSAKQRYKDVDDKLDEERQRAMSRALRKMNMSVLLGEKNQGSASKPASAGGIDYWLRTISGTVNDNYSGTFTETKFKNTLQSIADRGGAPDLVIMSTAMKATFNDLNNSYTQTSRDERTAGQIVDLYEADGIGTLRLVADPRLASAHGTMYVLNSRKLAKAWFTEDELRFEEEPSNSRVIEETLQGQFSFKMKDVLTDHARVYGL